jgi:hypothetical protein
VPAASTRHIEPLLPASAAVVSATPAPVIVQPPDQLPWRGQVILAAASVDISFGAPLVSTPIPQRSWAPPQIIIRQLQDGGGAAARTATDALGTTDAATRAALALARTATDGLATTDVASRAALALARTAADSLGTTDVATRAGGVPDRYASLTVLLHPYAPSGGIWTTTAPITDATLTATVTPARLTVVITDAP